MSKIKGTDIVILKRVLRERGSAVEDKFMSELDGELVELYQNVMHTTWAPVEKMLGIYEAAADALFPNDPNRLVKLGKMVAENSFTTVYKIFVRTTSIESTLNRIGMIWNAYHISGKIVAQKAEGNMLDLVVSEYPDLPRNMRMIINGHFITLMELIGCKNVSVTNHDSDPNAWRWHIQWE